MTNSDNLFSPGPAADVVPEGDAAREAVHSIRGYAYQALAAALAWVDIEEKGRLYLEVAEDYAVVVDRALSAVQVKDTKGSGPVTLNSGNVRDAITAFVDLVGRNPGSTIDLRYFTTSEIGTEQATSGRPAGVAGLEYWRIARAGADLSPLRAILESDKFPEAVRSFVKARDDTALRSELINKMHWDCGRPDYSTLTQELEERLIVVGRDLFGLPATEARKLSDLLVYRVLKKSIVKKAWERVLTRAELYEAIDSASRISMPRTTIETLAQITSGLAGSSGPEASDKIQVDEGPAWLIDGNTLPAPRSMVPRIGVTAAVADVLGRFGTAFLIGGSGLGKSNISRAVATARAGGFTITDFRDLDGSESRRRLDMVFARVGGLPSSVLILEDLNPLEEVQVRLSLGRVLEALRRRDRFALITCYRRPSANALANLALNPDCVVDCPYFSEDEAHELVRISGGDSNDWGRLAYVAGAGGHPQLTHAFVFGMAARSWPVDEIRDIVERGISTGDIDAAREAARRNLASALPEQTRALLYRLALMTARFSRSLSLIIGALPPPISQPGECMDQLVGPWVEAVGKDLFRVSPLASSFGREMLAPPEQRRIHETVAVQMLAQRDIDARDADAILMHAIVGRSAYGLSLLAQSVLTANSRTLEMLAEHLTLLPTFRAEIPIFPDNPSVSGMLRLAQFKLVASAADWDNVPSIVAALFTESAALPESELRGLFELLALSTVLSTMGIANYLQDWFTILRRYKPIVEASELARGLVNRLEASSAVTNFLGALFSIGTVGIDSVERLELIIDQLDGIDETERTIFLTPVDKSFSDYSVFINAPWILEQRRDNFDSIAAALCYQRMAQKTRPWNVRSLTIQCWVARAAILDEYANEEEGALAVLREAAATMGDDSTLSRARAKIYWRHDEHAKALEILRGIADQIGRDSPVERAFALREAAISAAKCGEWDQAERWFLDGQAAARLAETEEMRAMSIGLGADAAVAALEAGFPGRALERLGGALEALARLDPDGSLNSAYCHRVVRHAVLWARSRFAGDEIRIGGKPVVMLPGTCSNPDPSPSIRELPLGHADLAWYMLAETDTVADLDTGITAELSNRLTQGSIPFLESELRTQIMNAAIRKVTPGRFATNLMPFVEGIAYLYRERSRLKAFNTIEPERGSIPAIELIPPFDPIVEQAAAEAILVFDVCAALEGRIDAIAGLEGALAKTFTADFPGKLILDQWNGKPTSLSELDRIILDIIRKIIQDEHFEPREFWIAGLRVFERTDQSNFKRLLTPLLAKWQRAGWQRIIAQESFRLFRPRLTVPGIEAALRTPSDDQRFVAGLLLAGSEALGSPLVGAYRDRLRAIAEESGSSPSAAQ